MTTLFYGFLPDYVPAVAVASLVLLTVAASRVGSRLAARRHQSHRRAAA